MHTHDKDGFVREEGCSNEVEIRIEEGNQIESLVLAYRKDGEINVLAERTGTASAIIEGQKLSDED